MAQAELGGTRPPAPRPPILWDRIVRISHWGIVIVILANEVFTKGGSPVHVWFGWGGLVLLVLRMAWGIVGNPEARFSAFPPNPLAAIGHVKQLFVGKPRSYASHNPAGALMAYALWACIAVMVATGLTMSGPNPFAVAERQAIIDSGDWSQLVKTADAGEGGEEEGSGWVKDVHEITANLILLLVALHIGGVIVESVMMRHNLVPAMLVGRRKDKFGK
ncbi:cytochrome b/b6 domain-containing protein [Cypionkella psychrotolerans]|uniref:cytochrome b/b6 domain-containing protein n=1 Tax=Cypionkella psychrotolerans TaxID=1678131 RepID=UPI0006B67A74|nr:cytochrome b/b6 domain-containing protein [Cypionkella psychrotolerans]